MHARTCTHTITYTHPCHTRTHMHVHTHTHTHACTHTHTHTHTGTHLEEVHDYPTPRSGGGERSSSLLYLIASGTMCDVVPGLTHSS